jgi:hypothetical protein
LVISGTLSAGAKSSQSPYRLSMYCI